MAYIPSSGSVVTFQGNPSVLQGLTGLMSTNASVITVGGATGNSSVQVLNFPTTQNVSGSVASFPQGTIVTSLVSTIPSSVIVGASIFGLPPVNVTNTNLNVSGSVAAWLQSTNASVITVGGATGNSSVQVLNFPLTQNVSGSVAAFQAGTTITSLVSTVPSSVIVGASIFGLPPVNVTNTNLNVGGSVVAFQGAGWSGSVAAFQAGTQITSLVSTVPSSVIVGTSIFGQLPAGTAPLGSVAALQGTSPWNIAGSVAAIRTGQSGTVITSISGSFGASVQGTVPVTGPFAEDAGHTTGDLGFPMWGVRNDAVSSITSAERDYSPIAVDEVGRNIIVPFAGQQACLISYFGSIVSGSVQLIQASVIGSRSYITDFWLSNTGATTTLVTFQGGDTSILGQFIAPTGGGMASPGIAIPLRTTRSQDLAFKVSPSTSILYVVVKGYQAP